MERRRKLYWAKTAVVMGAFSLVLWAYEYGPDPGVCNVPGEHGTCAQSGCHTGTTNNPANQGSIAISFPNGLTYAPGVLQHLTVKISDPAPTQAAWGFQLTARPTSNSATMAGSFSPSDPYTQIMCSQTNLNVFQTVCLPQVPGQGQGCSNQSSAPVCPANNPLQYMEHSYSGYLHTQGLGSGSYQIDWTPPATNVGEITFSIAGNAGVAGPPNKNGDHIYATTFKLAATSANAPTVASVATATGVAQISPNTYVSIYGSNLSTASDPWDSHIVNGKLPTQLDGVNVTIGGKAAFVSYVSPAQINVLTPPDLGTGQVAVQVSNSNGVSAPVNVTSQQFAPGFFLWPNGQPVATHADFTWAVKNGTFSGVTTVAAKPAEYVVLWGTGFGPTTPPTPGGTLVPNDGKTTYFVATVPSLSLGGKPMTYYAAALAPTWAGLYQVIAQVPSTMADGDYPIQSTVGGISSPTGVVLTVKH